MDMKTAEDLRNLVKSVRDKTFPYEKREDKNRNWHQYDQAEYYVGTITNSPESDSETKEW